MLQNICYNICVSLRLYKRYSRIIRGEDLSLYLSLSLFVCVFVSVSYMLMPQERRHAASFFETEPDHDLSVLHRFLFLIV